MALPAAPVYPDVKQMAELPELNLRKSSPS